MRKMIGRNPSIAFESNTSVAMMIHIAILHKTLTSEKTKAPRSECSGAAQSRRCRHRDMRSAMADAIKSNATNLSGTKPVAARIIAAGMQAAENALMGSEERNRKNRRIGFMLESTLPVSGPGGWMPARPMV